MLAGIVLLRLFNNMYVSRPVPPLGQDTQTELVMLILLRLAEDVITFQTLPHQRRRDIQHTLTQNMDGIFNFLLTILQQHIDEYRKLVGHCGGLDKV